ncbi:hypothetical protein FPV67DRAFT_1474858 [Lyophyllum atratum]|nr:hypothetical protein FPV67DRAFT_1474858 [Lyophyllum atratum]
MVAIRNVRSAARQHVPSASVNRKRKPRHVDNGLLAISFLYRIKDKKQARWLTIDSLERILEVFYKKYDDKHSLGVHFQRTFKNALEPLEEAGVIRYKGADKNTFRVSKAMTTLLTDVAGKIEQMGITDEVEKHYAHCDYLRQKISRFRPTLKRLMDEIDELTETNRVWAEHAKTCSSTPMRPAIARTISIATNVSFNESETLDSDDEMSMDEGPVAGPSSVTSNTHQHTYPPSPSNYGEEPVAESSSAAMATPRRMSRSNPAQDPIAGPSSAKMTTPPRRPSVPNPAAAYMTPESLPRRGGGVRPLSTPPMSPSRSRTPSVRNDPSVDNDYDDDQNDMDIDHGPIAGPSGSSPSGSDDTLGGTPDEESLRARCNELQMDFEKVAALVYAPEATATSIQEVLEAQRAAAADKDETISFLETVNTIQESDINALTNQLDAQYVDHLEEMDHLRMESAAAYQKLSIEKKELADEATVADHLLSEVRGNYKTLLDGVREQAAEEQQRARKKNEWLSKMPM